MSSTASRWGRLRANACASSSVRQKPNAQLAQPSKQAIIRMKPGDSLAALQVSATWRQKSCVRSSSTMVMCRTRKAPVASGPRWPSGPSKPIAGIGVCLSPGISPSSVSLSALGGNTCSIAIASRSSRSDSVGAPVVDRLRELRPGGQLLRLEAGGELEPADHVVEADERGRLPDRPLVEAGLAQAVDVRLLDHPRLQGELAGIREQGTCPRAELVRLPLVGEPGIEVLVAGQPAQRLGVNAEARAAAEQAEDDDADHLSLASRQGRVGAEGEVLVELPDELRDRRARSEHRQHPLEDAVDPFALLDQRLLLLARALFAERHDPRHLILL